MKRTERVGALIRILTESPNKIYSLHGSLTPPSSKNLSKRCKRLIFLSIS